jgi:hypothetical protein
MAHVNASRRRRAVRRNAGTNAELPHVIRVLPESESSAVVIGRIKLEKQCTLSHATGWRRD